jgi:hypothetical protein
MYIEGRIFSLPHVRIGDMPDSLWIEDGTYTGRRLAMEEKAEEEIEGKQSVTDSGANDYSRLLPAFLTWIRNNIN